MMRILKNCVAAALSLSLAVQAHAANIEVANDLVSTTFTQVPGSPAQNLYHDHRSTIDIAASLLLVNVIAGNERLDRSTAPVPGVDAEGFAETGFKVVGRGASENGFSARLDVDHRVGARGTEIDFGGFSALGGFSETFSTFTIDPGSNPNRDLKLRLVVHELGAEDESHGASVSISVSNSGGSSFGHINANRFNLTPEGLTIPADSISGPITVRIISQVGTRQTNFGLPNIPGDGEDGSRGNVVYSLHVNYGDSGVPEPATGLMVLLGLGSACARRRR